MMYQLRQYLEDNLPNENIYANLVLNKDTDKFVPDRIIALYENPSTIQPRTLWTNKGLQVITRDVDAVKSRKLAWDVMALLDEKFSLTINSVTVDGNVYPAIEISQISANGEPQSIGLDEESRPEFTTNYRILYRRV
jgi:hypothetical protein